MLCQLHTAAVVTSVISSTPHPGLKPRDSSSSSTNVRRMFGRLSTFILPPPVLKLYLLLAIAKSGLQTCVQSSCYVRACAFVCVCVRYHARADLKKTHLLVRMSCRHFVWSGQLTEFIQHRSSIFLDNRST